MQQNGKYRVLLNFSARAGNRNPVAEVPVQYITYYWENHKQFTQALNVTCGKSISI